MTCVSHLRIGALFGNEDCELCSEGKADEEGWTDAAEEIASVGPHGQFLAGGVGRQRDEGCQKGVENRVAPHARLRNVSMKTLRTGSVEGGTDARPLGVELRLGIWIGLLRDCECALCNLRGGANAKRIAYQVLLGAPTHRGFVDDIDGIAPIKEP